MRPPRRTERSQHLWDFKLSRLHSKCDIRLPKNPVSSLGNIVSIRLAWLPVANHLLQWCHAPSVFVLGKYGKNVRRQFPSRDTFFYAIPSLLPRWCNQKTWNPKRYFFNHSVRSGTKNLYKRQPKWQVTSDSDIIIVHQIRLDKLPLPVGRRLEAGVIYMYILAAPAAPCTNNHFW